MPPVIRRTANRAAQTLVSRSWRAAVSLAGWAIVVGVSVLPFRDTTWVASAQSVGLVAAYGFEEGAGTTTADVSGNGNTGTLAGATWTASGMYGGRALSFNGAAHVTVPDSASLDLTTAMTIEAWVMPSVAPSTWSSVVTKDVDSYYLMGGTSPNGRPAFGATFGGIPYQITFAPALLAVNQWTHLAATYDGTAVRLYVSGVEVATSPRTGPITTTNGVLTIGSNSYDEYFSGLIDEIRIYNRALTVGEIQVDMGLPLSSAPRLIINQPAAGSLIASTTVNVSYSASGDLAEVNHVHFQLDGAPVVMDLTMDGVYQFSGVAAGGHTLSGTLVRADHSSIPNTGASVNFSTTVPDVVPPVVSIVSPTSGATVSGIVTVAASASDAVGVAGVQFKIDGANLGAEDVSSPYDIQLNTALVANGAHTVTAVARDLGGNSTTATAVGFTVANTTGNDPAQIGQWSAVFNWPNVALHAALLPTGKVLSWADHSDADGVQLWNPATGTFQSIPYTAANLFCAGLTFLADGRLLTMGGHIANYVGIRNTTIFDSWSETWVTAAPMTYGRWYPTATILADGRVLTTSGGVNCPTCNIPGDPHNGLADIAEIYNPANNTWSQLSSIPYRLPMYPHNFLLPDGRIFASSANADPIASAVLNLNVPNWTTFGPVRDGGSAVMYAPGKVMKSGTAWNIDYPIGNSAATTYVIDMTAASPAWRQTPSMSFARTEHTLVLLPDGNVLAAGGSRDSNVFNLAPVVYEAEMWSPATETWSTMARMDVPRHYHSTAMLLPDARVLMTGSGTFGIDQKNAQIYSPPYLFKGARPAITSAPGTAIYGSVIAVQTPDAARVASVTAMALPAVTHAFDANQRKVELPFSSRSGALDVTLPTNANLMPPGYYMLFLLDTNGVPSISRMLKVSAVAAPPDTVPPTAPGGLSANASGTSISLGWTAATDNVGVTGYQLERCQGPGCNNFAVVAAPSGTAYLDTGLLATTSYSYRVRAADAAGNQSVFSNIASATTGSSSGPVGLVASYAFDEGSGTTVADLSGNALTGSISGATWSPTGKYGSALSFNGASSYVDLGNPAALRLQGSMTLEAWINAAANPGDDGQIVAKSDGASGWQFKTSPDTGPHTFGLMVSGSGGGVQRYSATTRALNTWYHFAAVYDAAARTMSTYVNGVLDNGFVSGTAPAAQLDAPVNVNIGRRTGGFYFNGLIDEVRIYDRALTPAEIAADMNTRIGEPPPPDTAAPTVSMTAPGDGSTATGTVTLTASASDNVAMGGVQFLLDGANLGPEVAGAGPAFSYTWNSATAANGPHTLSARARDAAHNTATSATISVTASNDTTAPTVSLTSPVAGASLTGDAVLVVSASDNVAVAGVQFLLDGANLGAEATGPGPSYTYSWNTVPVANGIHTVSARARDAAGNSTVAAAVSVTVANTDTTGPTVSVTSPAGGATVAGTLSITASATDVSGVAGVQFLLDGANLGAEVTGAGPNFTYGWNSSTIANGTHTLSARARDTRNNTTVSAGVTLTVSNDLTAPAVSVTFPTAGSSLTGTVTLRATATDNVAMAGVRFLLDGANLGAEVTGAGPTYTLSWNTTTVANGTHTIAARARDASNNLTTSANVPITLSNDKIAPTVALTAPSAGASLAGTVALSATASDNVAMGGVTFLVDGVAAGSEVAGAGPAYTMNWNTATVTAGAHTFSARARDAANNTTTTAAISATVSNPASAALIAGYSFNAGSGTTATDSSPNGITGTLSGATWTTAGQYGNALSFNGTTSYVNLGTPAALSGTGSMTWAAWVYATANPGDDGQIIAKGSGNNGWEFKTSPDTGPHTFAIGIRGSSGGFVQRFSSTTRSLNTWYHVAAVYNATARTLDIYVNGVLNNGVLSGNVPAGRTVPNVAVNIGRRSGGFYFNGVIDDLRVYSRALTPAEIQTVKNTPLP
jgi:hypothetical protein